METIRTLAASRTFIGNGGGSAAKVQGSEGPHDGLHEGSDEADDSSGEDPSDDSNHEACRHP